MYIYEISDHSTCNKIANLCNKSGIKYKSCLSYYCQFPINNFILIYTKPNNNKSITHKHNNLQSLSFSLAIYRPMHVWLLDLSKIAVCAIQCHQFFFSLFNARGHLNLNIFKHCILNTHVYTFDWLGGAHVLKSNWTKIQNGFELMIYFSQAQYLNHLVMMMHNQINWYKELNKSPITILWHNVINSVCLCVVG